jgi:TetR/AcrR family transcriptional regulator, transcriptional repressor for nem operon
MPYSAEHKQNSREQILRGAMTLFAHKGFANVSIDELMAEAGMTRGAFYAHFKTKSELYAEAVMFAALNSKIVTQLNSADTELSWFTRVVDTYLDASHVETTVSPCPLAFLATDVANSDPQVRQAYTDVYKGLVKLFDTHRPQRMAKSDPDLNLAITAMMIGGVAVSRALQDKTLVKKLLKSCRAVAHRLAQGE